MATPLSYICCTTSLHFVNEVVEVNLWQNIPTHLKAQIFNPGRGWPHPITPLQVLQTCSMSLKSSVVAAESTLTRKNIIAKLCCMCPRMYPPEVRSSKESHMKFKKTLSLLHCAVTVPTSKISVVFCCLT